MHKIHQHGLTHNILRKSSLEVLGCMTAQQSHSKKGSIDQVLRIVPFCCLDSVKSSSYAQNFLECLGNYKPVHAILQSVGAGAGPDPDARKFPQTVMIRVA